MNKEIITGEIKKYKIADGYRKVNGRNHGFNYKDVWVLSVRFDNEDDARKAKKLFDEQSRGKQ